MNNQHFFSLRVLLLLRKERVDKSSILAHLSDKKHKSFYHFRHDYIAPKISYSPVLKGEIHPLRA